MRLFGLHIGWEQKAEAISLDTLIRRLDAAFETGSGVVVTPETCMESPTVHAVVTGVSRRMAALPAHVMRKTVENKRIRKERLPNHPVQMLLDAPSSWQSRTDYWLDAVSAYMRYGNYYALKAGPSERAGGRVRQLFPLHGSSTDVVQEENLDIKYRVTLPNGRFREYSSNEIHHVRGPARNYYKGDSPIMDVRETIALEIAAERFGASFFGNGAMPGIIFKFIQGVSGFASEADKTQFLEDFHKAYGQKRRFRGLVLPPGMEIEDPISVDNEKTQFIEMRQAQRSVIAGALGVPPHLAGDLSRATFSNIEQQSLDFVLSVVLPIARVFEAAMERDFLTDQERRDGVIIRFNLDAALRGDFKSRQEGLAIQRQNGVINANEWRENEGMNPRDDEEGETYFAQGPSGQTGTPEPGGRSAPSDERE